MSLKNIYEYKRDFSSDWYPSASCVTLLSFSAYIFMTWDNHSFGSSWDYRYILRNIQMGF